MIELRRLRVITPRIDGCVHATCGSAAVGLRKGGSCGIRLVKTASCRVACSLNAHDLPRCIASRPEKFLQKSKCFIWCRLGAGKPFFLLLGCTELRLQ